MFKICYIKSAVATHLLLTKEPFQSQKFTAKKYGISPPRPPLSKTFDNVHLRRLLNYLLKLTMLLNDLTRVFISWSLGVSVFTLRARNEFGATIQYLTQMTLPSAPSTIV